MFEEIGINAGYVEELQARYVQSPHSVDPEWRACVDSLRGVTHAPAPVNGETPKTNGNGAAHPIIEIIHAAPPRERSESLLAAAAMQGRVYQLVNAYRVRGHLFARVDPLGTLQAPHAAEL